MTITELEKIVGDERETLEAIAATRPMTDELIRRYEAVRQRLVALERELCLTKQLPVALPLEKWALKWTQYHDKVHLSLTETAATLMCEVYETSPDLFVSATVSFRGPVASKLVAIDYDEIEEHPMFHSGLEGLGAYSVMNSTWMRELNFDGGHTCYFHFLFCFSSCIVEVIAKDLDVGLGKARRGTPPGIVLPVR